LAVVSALALFGTAVLYSAAGGSMTPWAGPHLEQFVVFVILALAIRFVPLDAIRAAVIPAYAVCLLLLLLVNVLGHAGGGSQRWLNLGFLTLQPSELTKLAIVLALARFFERLPPIATRSWSAVWPPMLMLLLPAILIVLQPDLDAALLLILIGAVIMFLAGLPLRLFIATGLAAAIMAPLAFHFALKDYQKTRILGFLNPESDPLGTGYHAIQAKIAIGSGGLWGKGFMAGTQSRLSYLPEHNTDLVFASLFEEWGLIGGIIVLLAYLWILRWGMRTAQMSSSRFGKMAAAGLTLTLFSYIAMHIATSTAVTPIMGQPLPLISHGGSAMLTVMLLLGLLMSIDRDARARPKAGIY
jgi:rod shape determining protein RodA